MPPSLLFLDKIWAACTSCLQISIFFSTMLGGFQNLSSWFLDRCYLYRFCSDFTHIIVLHELGDFMRLQSHFSVTKTICFSCSNSESRAGYDNRDMARNSECRAFSAGTKIVVAKNLENTIWQCFWRLLVLNKILWTTGIWSHCIRRWIKCIR
jgi:hypothetical protein